VLARYCAPERELGSNILSHSAGVAVVLEPGTDLLLLVAGLFSAPAINQMHLRK
jgi:hypothetical protein